MSVSSNLFQKFFIDRPSTFFEELKQSAVFDPVCEGREAAVLVDCKTSNAVPIVRTTTVYDKPAQPFRKIHYGLISDLNCAAPTNNKLHFNNALFESYTERYTKMGFHSDQALDLKEDTFIAVYSCYNSENPQNIRTLVVKNKETGQIDKITMDHNSVVLFNLQTNQQYVHKIVVVGGAKATQEQEVWLGLTLRCSKTSVTFRNGIPFINNDRELVLASEKQRREFCRLRSLENKRVAHVYPQIEFTISRSDLLPPQQTRE